MSRVLVVHPDRNARNLIADSIQDGCEDVIVDSTGNDEDARGRLRHQADVRDRYALVVTTLNLPAKRRDTRNDTSDRGIELLRCLPELGHEGTPAVLVAASIDIDLQMKTQGITPLFPAKDGTELDEQIAEYAKRLLCQAPREPQNMLARVTLTLDLTNRRWDYTIKGVGFLYSDGPRPLRIDERTIEDLISRSQRPPRNDEFWERDLRDIGEALAQHIFTNNLQFLERVTEAATKAGGADRKVICFNIEEKVHPAMLEAITPPDDSEMWMLEVPIYRRLITTGQIPLEQRPLFAKSGKVPFRALIIESPVAGYVTVGGNTWSLDRIEFVPDEAEMVERKFRDAGASHVERVNPENIPAGESFKTYLQKLLTRPGGGADIVHYCGHSYYDERSGKGYLFFPGQPIDTLELEIFSTWLTQTSFLFLSACQSSQQGFVFQLARHQIPVVLGFRWAIDDDAAMEFTNQFYTNLFEGPSAYCFDRAFLLARRAMKDWNRKNKIWAAPMLILQATD